MRELAREREGRLICATIFTNIPKNVTTLLLLNGLSIQSKVFVAKHD